MASGSEERVDTMQAEHPFHGRVASVAATPPQLPQTRDSADGYLIPFQFTPRACAGSALLWWHTLRRYSWLVTICTLTFSALGTTAAFLMTPQYRAEVLFVPAAEDGDPAGLSLLKGQFGSIAALAGVSVGDGAKKDTALAILQSRAFTEAFIAEQDLLPRLFSDVWDAQKQQWTENTQRAIPTIADGWKRFSKIRSVSENRKTGLITLSIEWRDSQLAAQWANDLVSRANAHLRDEATQAAAKNMAYLREQLDRTSQMELHQALYRLLEAEMKKVMLANASTEFAFKVIDPAVAAGEDDFSKPKRPLLVSAGILLGLVLGVIGAFFANFVASLRGSVNRTQDTDGTH